LLLNSVCMILSPSLRADPPLEGKGG